MQQFLREIADVLDVPSIGREASFREVPLWGSLTAFALLIFLEQQYHVRLSAEDLAACQTVQDLAVRAGVIQA